MNFDIPAAATASDSAAAAASINFFPFPVLPTFDRITLFILEIVTFIGVYRIIIFKMDHT